MTPALTTFGGYSLFIDIPVTPSTRYVLSGYLDASGLQPGQSLYLDLDDEPFDPDINAVTGVAGWQFVLASFNVPAGTTSLRVRVVHDGNITPTQSGYADEIAVTPEAMFALPGQGCM